MKILTLSYEYPPIGGGGGVICKYISENLAKMGNVVTILTTAFHGIPNSKFQIPNLRVIRLAAFRKNTFESNPFEMISWINVTKRFISDNPSFVDFDVCMAHFVLPGGEVARWLKRKYGLPYVLISHGHDIPWVHPRQMFFFHFGTYLWIKSVCRESSLNFIQTRMMKDNIDRFTGEKHWRKNILIPNGVDNVKFIPDYTKRTSLLRIIFTGRLVIQKDPITFLKALRLFSQQVQDFEVHVLGDGNMRKKMERFVKNNRLAANVKFSGKIPEEEMVAEYQTAHLMIAPSLNEGMSISALEALSCGVYLISTRASGYEDMIRETQNGTFVEYRGPGDIYERLMDFYRQNRKEQPVDEANLKKFREHFNWENISRTYYEELESINQNGRLRQ
jgi:glycosyltransferase involved in cell wall biosynthesis